jgi:hypothetical protein
VARLIRARIGALYKVLPTALFAPPCGHRSRAAIS